MMAMSSAALKHLEEVEEKEQKRRSWWISSCGESENYRLKVRGCFFFFFLSGFMNIFYCFCLLF